jgi:hypothetical protein
VISAIVEATQVALEMDPTDEKNVLSFLSDWNKSFGHQVDYLWRSRSKRHYRTALEKTYGSEDGQEYVAKKLGTIEEGLEKMRREYKQHLDLSFPVVVSKPVARARTNEDYETKLEERVLEARLALDAMRANTLEIEMVDLSTLCPSPSS